MLNYSQASLVDVERKCRTFTTRGNASSNKTLNKAGIVALSPFDFFAVVLTVILGVTTHRSTPRGKT